MLSSSYSLSANHQGTPAQTFRLGPSFLGCGLQITKAKYVLRKQQGSSLLTVSILRYPYIPRIEIHAAHPKLPKLSSHLPK